MAQKLTDESLMPCGYYKDCKMVDVPAWHLLEMYEKSDSCNVYVYVYVEENIETLKMEMRK